MEGENSSPAPQLRMFMRTTLQPAARARAEFPKTYREEEEPQSVNDDHCQPLAADLGGLPMAMAQHETGSVGVGGFDLDEPALRFRQRKSARQEGANDRLQMAAAQETRRHKGSHPR